MIPIRHGWRTVLLIAAICGLLLTAPAVASASDLTVNECVDCHPEIEVRYDSLGNWTWTAWHPDIYCAYSGCHWPGGPVAQTSYVWDGYIAPWSWTDHHSDPCTYCHTQEYPTVPQHTEENVTSSHTRDNRLCRGCHSASLVAEHDGCRVCHASTESSVVSAIDAGNISCDACHTVVNGHGGGTKAGSGK